MIVPYPKNILEILKFISIFSLIEKQSEVIQMNSKKGKRKSF